MLADYAVSDENSKGRAYPEPVTSGRSAFQKDRDRIIHCRSFRRLNSKTQVFVANQGDHYRTRLTHTIEVSQVSRDIARDLGLNEDLAESIALAHDLGHTPFGHAGEMAMNRYLHQLNRSFEHNEQSKRVVTLLERMYPDFPGLNLSFEVLDGLSKHQTPWDNPNMQIEAAPSLEAQVVNIADEIAYSNHDIDDGLRAGLLIWNDLTSLRVVDRAVSEVFDRYGDITDSKIRRSRVISTLIGIMIKELADNTKSNIEDGGIKSLSDVYGQDTPIVSFASEFRKQMHELKDFLHKNFYLNPEILKLTNRGEHVIEKLFDYYLSHIDEIPAYLRGEDDIISVKDYISGMTDTFAEQKFEDLC
ncbi:deoxyguanosinetriphosphate triphosphohydrolase [Candidatus Peregrinibacteria bacterium CG10_big_fil_rev_8_21_14_0_10_44_7]|nr:MAG: hypothetical protein AUK45_02955 [Candidatus Peregrinibacteria bacterium CG2_30_44_17]PIS03930.1 MAG: deoxyguanosinetriphosphate triphosphohydrolase [Candidatus Peregrinibacteria bacterium CG10_big_fil_rev_8_21_14_0_10_44_7]PIX79374.1 MAG: deoxyguanosinetriphosphate triphosphohydrolase [Candidatus Peregrinibacteria bacterium CG_4_10_14_3_um_filter_44_21]PJB89177.1 MAG: deoxyguanosinetriphosphate triphosphohydrolase [Candidatus Peregrinibacteria bacterium CG_4_9_14_0_8_um_filter_44_15]